METLIRLLREEKGATAIEYGLLITLISVAAIAGMTAVGGSLQAFFATANADLR